MVLGPRDGAVAPPRPEQVNPIGARQVEEGVQATSHPMREQRLVPGPQLRGNHAAFPGVGRPGDRVDAAVPALDFTRPKPVSQGATAHPRVSGLKEGEEPQL